MPEVHLVAVDREDFLLGVALLDLDREDRLANLALERLLVVEAELFLEVARELLRQRARALRAAAFDDVGHGGDEDAPDVHAEVAIELRVLGGDDRLAQQRVDVVVADDDAALGGELADHLATGRIDPGDGAGGIVVEGGDLRQVSRVREHDAAEDAEDRGNDEQRHQAGVAGDFDDYVGQMKGPQLQYSMRLRGETSGSGLHDHTQLLYLSGYQAPSGREL